MRAASISSNNRETIAFVLRWRKGKSKAIMVAIVVCCVIFSGLLVSDLIKIHQFFNGLQERAVLGNNSTITNNVTDDRTDDNIGTYVLQKDIAYTLLVLILFQVVCAFGVYVGIEKKKPNFLLGYLILTVPVMVFSLMYLVMCHLFLGSTSSSFVVTKIGVGFMICLLESYMLKVVMNIYKILKYQRTCSYSNRARIVNLTGNSITATYSNEPEVILQLQPPPYEKEPPPYALVCNSTSWQETSLNVYNKRGETQNTLHTVTSQSININHQSTNCTDSQENQSTNCIDSHENDISDVNHVVDEVHGADVTLDYPRSSTSTMSGDDSRNVTGTQNQDEPPAYPTVTS